LKEECKQEFKGLKEECKQEFRELKEECKQWKKECKQECKELKEECEEEYKQWLEEECREWKEETKAELKKTAKLVAEVVPLTTAGGKLGLILGGPPGATLGLCLGFSLAYYIWLVAEVEDRVAIDAASTTADLADFLKNIN
jgi:23S rRNA pseudoU1915 N3-methylase RlmH